MDHRQIALDNAVFSVIAGSNSFGLSIEGSDEDYKGAFIAPPNLTFGLETFEEFREEPMHFASFRKWGLMLAESKPNYIEYLFVPDHLVKTNAVYFRSLVENRDQFLTQAFVGQYTDMAKGLSRRAQKLQPNAASDVVALQRKQSQHALRVIWTLRDFMQTGKFNIFRTLDRQDLLDVRFGKRDLLDVDVEVKSLADEIDAWALDSELPKTADRLWVNSVVISGTKQYWRDKKWL